jgi:hypothetical protein
MRLLPALRTGLLIAALCLCAQGQDTPGKTDPINELKGLPPRASAGEYQAKAQTGAVTIRAEFVEHHVRKAPRQFGDHSGRVGYHVMPALLTVSAPNAATSAEDTRRQGMIDFFNAGANICPSYRSRPKWEWIWQRTVDRCC